MYTSFPYFDIPPLSAYCFRGSLPLQEATLAFTSRGHVGAIRTLKETLGSSTLVGGAVRIEEEGVPVKVPITKV